MPVFRVKPTPRFPFSPAFADEEWGWFWNELKVLHPMWEGCGAPRDVLGFNNGVPVGGTNNPIWITDKSGRALQFDESNDYYTVADSSDLTLPHGPWTIAFYYKQADNTGGAYQYYYSWGNFGVTPNVNLYCGEASSGEPHALFIELVDDSGNRRNFRANSAGLPFANYTLVVWRRLTTGSTTSDFSITVNGVERTLTQAAATGTLSTTTNRSDSLNIGRRSDGDINRYFGGEISWWAKWDGDIGDEAIKQLAKDPFGPFRGANSTGILTAGNTVITPKKSFVIGGSVGGYV